MPRRRFPHCAFGPFELRPLLRSKLLPGEVLVGWASVERAAVGVAKSLEVGLSMTPMVGPLLSAALTHPKHRFVLLTDSRVIVLDARKGLAGGRGPGLHVVAETPIGALRVAPTLEKRVFKVALDQHDGPQAIGVPRQKGAGSTRLLDALRLMARDGSAA